MVNFVTVLRDLDTLGLRDVILPFLLVFVVIFAIMQKTNILGKDRKNWSVIVALVMGLLVVIPHVTGDYPAGQDLVNILNNAIPNIAVLVVAVVMFLILIGLVGGDFSIGGNKLSAWMAILAAAVVFFIFGNSAGWFKYGWPNWLRFMNNPETQSLVIVVLVFGLVIWFVTKDDGPTKESGRWLNDLSSFIKGKK